MTPLEYTLGAIVSTIIAWLSYRSVIQAKRLETEASRKSNDHDNEQAFFTTLVTRVEKLELRTDTLQDKIKQAEEDRRKIIEEYEKRVELLRIEMRKLLDNATLELATWRDKYFTLIGEYHLVKAENGAMRLQLERLETEYKELKTVYEDKFKMAITAA